MVRVQGCNCALQGHRDVVYLKSDGTYHITWQEACKRDDKGFHLDAFPYPDRYCGGDGWIDGKRQHICMDCAKRLGMIW